MTDFSQPLPIQQPAGEQKQPTPDEGGNVYERLFADDARRSDDLLRESVRIAMQGDPARAREASRIGAQAGLPVDVTDRQLESVKKNLQRQKIEQRLLSGFNPTLARQMRDPEFARMAYDDFENLSTYEGLLYGLETGRLTVERGRIGSRMFFGAETPEDTKRLAEINQRLSTIPQSRGFVANAGEILGQMAQTLPKSLAAGAVTGSAAVVAGQLGPQALIPEEIITGPAAFGAGFFTASALQAAQIEGGSSYVELIAKGVDPGRARSGAMMVGLINGALGTGGLHVVSKPIRDAITGRMRKKLIDELVKPSLLKAAAGVGIGYAKVVGAEVGTEVLEEVTSIVTEGSLTGDWDGIGDRLGEVAVKTAQGMALIGVPGAGIHATQSVQQIRADRRRAAEAERTHEQVVRLMDNAAESSLRKDNPEAFEKMTAEMAAGTYQETVHFDGAALSEALFKTADEEGATPGGLLPIEELEKLIPGISDRVREAADSGGDVSIPLAEFLAKVSGEPVGKLLAPHVRFDKDAMSLAEAEKIDVDALAKDAETATEKETATREQNLVEAQKIADDLAASVVKAAPQIAKQDANRIGAFWRAVVETQADKVGETPAQFAAKYPLAAEAQDLPAGKKGGFANWRVVLPPDATREVVMHELSHGMLSMYAEMAAAKVHPSIVDDFGQFLSWAGVDSIETWRKMSFEQRRKHHENFAANLELHLLDGEAPTPKLQGMFDRFVEWLKRVYVNLTQGREKLNEQHRKDFGEDLLPLTPEIRAVMDRMIASEDAVRSAQAVRGAVPVFESQEESGLNDQQWIALRQKQLAADDKAIATMTKASLAVMRWLSREKGRRLRASEKEAQAVREASRGEVGAAVQSQPVYRAQRWLKKGEFVNPDGTHTQGERDENHKLRTSEVEAIGVELPGMTRADGLSADAVASSFGFDTGEQLIRALADAVPIADAIESALDAKMTAEHSELADPKKREAVVDRSLHNEARARFVAAELAALEKGPDRLTMAAAKVAAKRLIERKKVKDATPRNFGLAAKRAAKQAAEEVKAGNTVEAIRWKRRQLLNELAAGYSIGLREEVDKAKSLFDKFDASDKKLAKTRDIDTVYAGQVLASTYSLGKPVTKTQRRELLAKGLDEMQREEPELFARLKPLLDAAEGTPDRQLDFNDQTVAVMRELAQVGKALWEIAKTRNEIEVNGKRVELAEVVDKLTGAIGALPPRPPNAAPPAGQTPTPFQGGILKGWNILAALKRVESWAWFMDGQKEGPFTRFLFRPIERVATKFRSVQRAYVRSYHEQLTKLRAAAGDKWDARVYVPQLDFTFRGKKELVGMLLHTGTLSNFTKLLMGRKGKNGKTWGNLVEDESGERVLDSSRFDEAMVDLHEKGWLNAADVAFVKFVWGSYAKFLPLAQQTHKAVMGYEFETIEHRKVRIAGIELDGGYVPARPDRDEAAPQAQIDSIEDLDGRFRKSIEVPKGFTLARNENYFQPLSLDVARQLQHIDEELRYIHMQPAIKNAVRIKNNKAFKAALDAYDRQAIPAMIEPWLDTSARQSNNRASSAPGVDAVASIMRRATSLIALGGNVINAAIQVTGFSPLTREVKRSHFYSALAYVSLNPRESREVARTKSQVMAQRADILTRKLTDDVRAMVKGRWAEAREKVSGAGQRAAFFLQRLTQGTVDVAAWHGAYSHYIAEQPAGKDAATVEADAIEHADGVVRRTQGSTNPEDSAAYEAQIPLIKLFTQFGTFSNVMLNQILSAKPGVASKARAIWWSLVVTAIAEGTIRALLMGREPDDADDDGEGTIADWAAMFGQNIGRNVAGLLPGVGPALFSLAESEGTRVASPATVGLQTLAKFISSSRDAVTGEDLTEADIRAILAGLTVMTGIPFAAPARYLLPSNR